MYPTAGPTEDPSATPRLDEEALPTVVLPRGRPSLSHVLAHVGQPPVPRLSKETDDLRRKRLQAAAIFYLAAISLFLLWRVTLSGASGLWPLNVATMCGMAALLFVLYE